MRFDLSEDQELLRSATADFMSSECPLEGTRSIVEEGGEGFSRGTWKKLAELGYLGLLVAEPLGGQGLGPVELAVVCHEMGKVCFAAPYLDVVVAAKVLEQAGDNDALIAEIVSGDALVVIASVDRVWPHQPATVAYADGHLSGTKYFVPYGASADLMLVDVGDQLVVAEGPFASQAMDTFEEAARFVEVSFDGPARSVGSASVLELVADLSALGAAAHGLGLCEATMARAVDYSRERQTFGKPIGAYQVLQHRMADMLLLTESSRAVVYRAAWAQASGAADAAMVSAAAKAYAIEAAQQIAEDSLQIHGGNGFTWEYDVHCFLKRALTLSRNYVATEIAAEQALTAFERGE